MFYCGIYSKRSLSVRRHWPDRAVNAVQENEENECVLPGSVVSEAARFGPSAPALLYASLL